VQPDRFTVKSQEAVAAAQALAAERRNSEVTPAHLLVALLRQDDGLVPPILQKLSVDVGTVSAQAVQRVEDLPKLGETAEVRPSPALVKVLQESEREMAKLGDEYISTEHILLALTDSGSGVADVLPDRGALEEAVAEVRGPHKVTSPNPEDTMQALEKFGRDLTAEAESGELDPVIGRDEEIRTPWWFS
jgi:ATP-dependent Clp protease ATP-binding subunit ClpB